MQRKIIWGALLSPCGRQATQGVLLQTCELQGANVLVVGSGTVGRAEETGEHATEALCGSMKPSEDDYG